MYNKDNVFAKILKGEIPCNKVEEGEFFLAFHDQNPKAKVHVLVVPKGYYKDASDFHKLARDEEIIGFYKGIDRVCEKLNLKNYKLCANTGSLAGQEVFHYHIHILGDISK